MTQQGIAETIGIHLSHVPRSMKHLERSGLAAEVRAHIQMPEASQSDSVGISSRKRKAYFLTDKGITLTKTLKSRLENHKITFMDLKGGSKHLKLSALNKFLQDRERATLLNYYNFIFSEGQGEIFYLDKWRARLELLAQARKTNEYSLLFPKILNNMPRFELFFGREHELKLLTSSIDTDKFKLVLISGDKGIGKTALTSKAIEDYTGTKNIFWCETPGQQIFQELSHELSKLLAMANRRALKSHLTKISGVDKGTLTNIVQQDLQGISTLLIIDGVSATLKKSKELVDFAGFIESLIKNVSTLKIIINCGALEPLMLELNSKVGADRIRIIELKGLDKPSSKKLIDLSGAKISRPEFEGIYHHTGGNPSYLELIGTVKLDSPKGEDPYSAEERALLKYLKVVEKLGS